MVSQIYPSELQLNKANASDNEATLLDLHLSISDDIVPTKIYDKRDDFDFEIVNFFCGSFVLFMSCVCHASASVHWCLVVTCWERADLLDLVCDV